MRPTVWAWSGLCRFFFFGSHSSMANFISFRTSLFLPWGAISQVHRMVDADWHDGYDEQSEEVFTYFRVRYGEGTVASCCGRLAQNARD